MSFIIELPESELGSEFAAEGSDISISYICDVLDTFESCGLTELINSEISGRKETAIIFKEWLIEIANNIDVSGGDS